ncbi:MAG TPA: hypothetical protein VM509_03910, partial [Planctomycetota bacterium]|nr:hypothetical protein [Planctomycetota bacterium]
MSTTLDHSEIRNADVAWIEMIDSVGAIARLLLWRALPPGAGLDQLLSLKLIPTEKPPLLSESESLVQLRV